MFVVFPTAFEDRQEPPWQEWQLFLESWSFNVSLIHASLTCREVRHAPTKALPLLVPKCLRKLSVLATIFRIHKLKSDFAIFGRPYCISNCSSTHTETLVLPFLGDKHLQETFRVLFSQGMSYLLLPSMPESKMASMEPQGTQLQCRLLKDEKQDGLRSNSCMFVCVPPRDVQMGLCAPVVRTP